jgi:hypothetical protein
LVGYFTNGAPDQSYTGPYSFGYMNAGLFDSSYSSPGGSPNIAQDDNMLYVYNNGVPTMADGCINGNLYSQGTDLATSC